MTRHRFNDVIAPHAHLKESYEHLFFVEVAVERRLVFSFLGKFISF